MHLISVDWQIIAAMIFLSFNDMRQLFLSFNSKKQKLAQRLDLKIWGGGNFKGVGMITYIVLYKEDTDRKTK